ncbi:MAG: cofactor assembly of complex C subunit B, partial [Okeania sp. SIO2H7]|nr:cofactor assembly of complex C subunit B [Okeania sp. SIO2H7]
LALSMVFPQRGQLFLGLVLLSPLAGLFYWRKAGRPERVSVEL